MKTNLITRLNVIVMIEELNIIRAFVEFYNQGLGHETTPPYYPEMNIKAKRTESIVAILLNYGASSSRWREAYLT